MNKTSNYALNQWAASDRIQRTDFNADNAKIDAAIKAVDTKADTKAAQSALNALQTVVNGKGNCKIEIGSYQGDGTKNRTLTITASFKPKVVIVAGYGFLFMFQGMTKVPYRYSTNHYELPLVWSGNSVSWSFPGGQYADTILNENRTYYYIILG